MSINARPILDSVWMGLYGSSSR